MHPAIILILWVLVSYGIWMLADWLTNTSDVQGADDGQDHDPQSDAER